MLFLYYSMFRDKSKSAAQQKAAPRGSGAVLTDSYLLNKKNSMLTKNTRNSEPQ